MQKKWQFDFKLITLAHKKNGCLGNRFFIAYVKSMI